MDIQSDVNTASLLKGAHECVTPAHMKNMEISKSRGNVSVSMLLFFSLVINPQWPYRANNGPWITIEVEVTIRLFVKLIVEFHQRFFNVHFEEIQLRQQHLNFFFSLFLLFLNRANVQIVLYDLDHFTNEPFQVSSSLLFHECSM